jgi:hypothetical protein
VVDEDREIGLEAIAPSDVTEKSIAALIERADPEHILIVRYPAAEDTVCIEDAISCKLCLTHVMFVLPHRPVEELPKNAKVELTTGPGTPSEEGPMLSTTASKFNFKVGVRESFHVCM